MLNGGRFPPPLPPSAWAPRRRSRHRSARFVKRAGTCLHVRPKWTEKRKILPPQLPIPLGSNPPIWITFGFSTSIVYWGHVPFTHKRAEGSLHGVTFTPKRAERSLHGEGCFPDVQTALCTSAIRSGANLYTYIGPMVPRCSKWQVLVIVPFRTSADLQYPPTLGSAC